MPIAKATITRSEYTNVEISIDECLRIIEERAWATLGRRPPSSSHGGSMGINADGHWESWENTHGSGFTQEMEAATPAEVEMGKLFSALRSRIRCVERPIESVKPKGKA